MATYQYCWLKVSDNAPAENPGAAGANFGLWSQPAAPGAKLGVFSNVLPPPPPPPPPPPAEVDPNFVVVGAPCPVCPTPDDCPTEMLQAELAAMFPCPEPAYVPTEVISGFQTGWQMETSSAAAPEGASKHYLAMKPMRSRAEALTWIKSEAGAEWARRACLVTLISYVTES